MDVHDQQRQAAEALAEVHANQERARRAARLPRWVYPVMFLLIAVVTAINDFVDLNGAKVVALVVIVALVATIAVTFISGSAPLSMARGVQPRRSFQPRVFGAVVVIGAVGTWLISRYGNGFVHSVANAVGLRDYPNTVAGVLFGLVFTAFFAVVQLVAARREHR